MVGITDNLLLLFLSRIPAISLRVLSFRVLCALLDVWYCKQGGAACGRIEGADPPTLAQRVQELANEHVAQKSKGDGVEGMQPELKAKLKSIIGCVQVASSGWRRTFHVYREVVDM